MTSSPVATTTTTSTPVKIIKKQQQPIQNFIYTKNDYQVAFAERFTKLELSNTSNNKSFLPNEVLLQIVQFVPIKCIFQLMRISKQFVLLCSNEQTWKYLLVTVRKMNQDLLQAWLPHGSYMQFAIWNAVQLQLKNDAFVHASKVCTGTDKMFIYGTGESGRTVLYQALEMYNSKQSFDLSTYNYRRTLGADLFTAQHTTEHGRKESWKIFEDDYIAKLLSSLVSKSVMVLLVCDMSQADSLDKLQPLYAKCKQANPNAIYLIVGTKCDLPVQCPITPLVQWLQKEQLGLVACNVITNAGISCLWNIMFHVAIYNVTTSAELRHFSGGLFALRNEDVFLAQQ